MFEKTIRCAATVVLAWVVLTVSGNADAAGKIVCWKDKAGKVIGCGDTVPPEYQQSATKELDKRGITRKTTESAEEGARRRAQEQEQAQQQAEEQKRAAERKRQDNALINTFSNEQEIDAKRDRDVQAVELQINQLQVSLKSATDRHNDAKVRLDAAEKSKKPVPQLLKDNLAHATDDKQKFEAGIADKKKEQDEIRKKYAEYRKRYLELKGTTAPVPGTTSKK
jgi:hypothetical protein